MPSFKPAYLIHGDDHGRVSERRGRLRALAEADSGPGGVEPLEGDAATPQAVAAALSAMTFAVGRRFVIVDGVERWKDKEVAPVAAALESMDASTTTVAFFGREDGRTRVPEALGAAVTKAGGSVAAEMNVKPWELPRWAQARAAELGVSLDAHGARALVAHVGDRQQRLLRELEKLRIEYGPDASIGAEEVHASTAGSAERRVWSLGDAVVAADRPAAIRILLELRAQGESVARLLYALPRPLREALAAAEALAAGSSPAQVKRSLRKAPKAAERLVAAAQERDPAAYREALAVVADLELETRGGAATPLGEDTAALRGIVAATRA